MKSSKSKNTIKLAMKVRIKLYLITLFTFLLMALAKTSSAQVIGVTPFIEQNIMGVQKGLEVSSRIKDKFDVGYFFQATNNVSFEQDQRNYPFHGLSMDVRIKSCGDLQFWTGLKTGFVNGKYLAAVPQVTTEISLIKWLSVGIQASYRAGHPALGSAISIKL